MTAGLPQKRLARVAVGASFVLLLACCGLLVLTVYLWRRPPSPAVALAAPHVRARVIADLVTEGPGISDSHVDADVGRVQLPGLVDRMSRGIPVSTNRFGIREREYALPKPDGVVRVVLLGDSFVFGYGVRAEERFGALLEQRLREGAGSGAPAVEVLHLGVSSWNYLAGAAFLRRQLSDLAPDLVLHLSRPNDIEATVGVRGFGVWSSFSPQSRTLADSRIDPAFPVRELGYSRAGYVRHGLDYESRSRFARAVTVLSRLSGALSQQGVPYRVLFHHRRLSPVTSRYLGRHLPAGEALYLAEQFAGDLRFWISKKDYHWNPAGHRRAAQMLHGLILRERLLPSLDLAGDGEASAAYDEILVAGVREAEVEVSEQETLRRFGIRRISPALRFDDLDDFDAAQIHGGVDRSRRVSPYASFLLRNPQAGRVEIDGRGFDRPELDGAIVQVFVDAVLVGSFELVSGRPIRASFPLPSEVAGREFVSVRLRANDYVFVGPDLQHCVVFELEEVRLVP